MPYSPELSMLVLGASGYLGGSLLVALLKAYPSARFTALVRSAAHDTVLLAAGVHELVHAATDYQAVTKAASQADVVVNAADLNDLALVTALIDGLAQRTLATGRRAILLHTSGAFVAFDDAEGTANPHPEYINDASESDIKSIPATAMHRDVDLAIFRADEAGLISGYNIAPGIIFGDGRGPVGRVSVMFPTYVAISRAFGRGVVVGDGSNVAATVHVDDIVSLELLVLERALAETDLGSSPYGKFYFAATREITQREISASIAAVLHAKGLCLSPDLESLSLADAIKTQPLSIMTARNLLIKSDRAYAIGWKPTQFEPMTAGMEHWLEPALRQTSWT